MLMTAARIRMRRPGTHGPRGGGVFVTELQRARLLDAAFSVVSEDGYRRMTARRVSGRAGVSNKTFYDLFTDREDCFLAAFDHAVEEIAAVVFPAWVGEQEWATRVRAGLGALLGFLDGESEMCRLLFVEALGAGPRVLERRAEILGRLERVIDEGRTGGKSARPPQELPPLTAAGIVGATFSVIHGQLVEQPPEPLADLLNALMATIVLPYRGRKAAARELERPISKAGPDFVSTEKAAQSARSRQSSGSCAGPRRTSGSRAGRARIPFRLTVRTHRVLCAVSDLGAQGSNPSNKQVADAAGVSDQGQISKLLARLEGHGLLKNTGGNTQGVARAWRLTPRGEEIVRVGRPRGERANGHRAFPEAAR
jgi:AcrR family transcriptional regulator/DNA-binding MarR family transcriptional regulator